MAAERWAGIYRQHRTPWESSVPTSQLVDYTRKVSVAGLRAVELCCGTGASAVHLAKCGCALVVGVDIAESAVVAARERARKAGVADRCLFLCADAMAADSSVFILAAARAFHEQARAREDLRKRSLSGRVSKAMGSVAKAAPKAVGAAHGDDQAFQFDFAFDCQGFQLLWALDAEAAALALALLLGPGARLLTVTGNANEWRSYEGGGTSLTCSELVGALSLPLFSLVSLKETHFDAALYECDEFDGKRPERPAGDVSPAAGPREDAKEAEGLETAKHAGAEPPPLAWCALFERGYESGAELRAALARPPSEAGTPSEHSSERRARSASLSLSLGGGRDAGSRNDDSLRMRGFSREPPSLVAQLQQQQEYNFDDAIDAALSVDGSVAPSECGSDATSAFAGADGFENISASREAAARAEQARLEGDVPWVRWWDRHSAAYEAFVASQPLMRRLARRVARAALESSRALEAGADAAEAGGEEGGGAPPLLHVDLAAGSGQCAWAMADELKAARAASKRAAKGGGRLLPRRSLRVELVEPSHQMASLARARAAVARLGPQGGATVWQIPVERSTDRLPPHLAGACDVVTCSHAMACLNEHDVFEVANALLRPGGALAFDLFAESYDGAEADDHSAAWEPAVVAALASRGLVGAFHLGEWTATPAADADAPADAAMTAQPDVAPATDAAAASSPTGGPQDATGAEKRRKSTPAKAEAKAAPAMRPLDVKIKSQPPIRGACSASSIAAAAAAAGLRLAACDVQTHEVGGDFFIAQRAMSLSWLREPFEDISRADAKHLRAVVLTDAARRAAKNTVKIRVAMICVVKPNTAAGAFFSSRLGARSDDSPDDDVSGARPILAINNDHFAGR